MCLRGDYDKYSEDPEFKPATRHAKEMYEEVNVFFVVFLLLLFIYLFFIGNLRVIVYLDSLPLRVIQ